MIVFIIVAAVPILRTLWIVKILKTIYGIERNILEYFLHLYEISNAALPLSLIVLNGVISGSALACGACKSSRRPSFESRVKWASQCKKKRRPLVSATESYFTLSVVCLVVECTKRQRKGDEKKNIQIVIGQLGWKWIERSVLQIQLLTQKEVELLLVTYYKIWKYNSSLKENDMEYWAFINKKYCILLA